MILNWKLISQARSTAIPTSHRFNLKRKKT